MESIYAHYPGLVVLTPATVEDAYHMLLDAVALDDPVIFCEHKFLYYHLKADSLPDEAMPIGKARIARPGRHATVVTYSAMVHEAVRAAEELQQDGWEIEVVDLRSVKPLDTDTVLGSVARTGRLLGVGEAFPGAASRAEVVARVVAEGFPSARCAAAAPQRQGHARPLSSEPLGRPPPHRPRHRRRAPQTASRLSSHPIFPSPVFRFRCPRSPSSCRSSANPSPRPPSSACSSRPQASVAAGQEIIEVETNKAVMGVGAPCAGKIGSITAETAGQLRRRRDARLARSQRGRRAHARLRRTSPRRRTRRLHRAGVERRQTTTPRRVHFAVSDADAIREPGQPTVEPVVGGLPVPAGAAGASYISPRMRARMNELGLNAADLSAVAGSGAGGRVTVEDFEHFLATSTSTGSRKPRPCASPWPTPCAAAGPARWPPSAPR